MVEKKLERAARFQFFFFAKALQVNRKKFSGYRHSRI